MLRHVVLLTFTPETTTEQTAAVVDAVRDLPAKIPEIASCSVGPNLGFPTSTADLAIVVEFASAEDYQTYSDHPDHQAVIRDLIRPILADRAAVQYDGV